MDETQGYVLGESTHAVRRLEIQDVHTAEATERPRTRIGSLEPEFRAPLARLAFLEATGRPELAALRVWAGAINQLYQFSRLSPGVGASMARTLEAAGCRRVRAGWSECRSDG